MTGEKGTGKTARPAGYMIGGKTGTAQTLPRGNGQYVVSFMGYAPADDPQYAIYVVVDRPNVPEQADAKYATKIVRNILTEVLPYLNVFMTEELTDDERKELEELRQQLTIPQAAGDGEQGEGDGESGEEGAQGEGAEGEGVPEGSEAPEVWRNFPIDPETGYAKDPDTGYLVDPETGAVLNLNNLYEEPEGSSPLRGVGEPPEDDGSEDNGIGI